MNNLSVLIYLAEVSEGLSALFGFTAIASFVSGFAIWIFTAIDEKDAEDKVFKFMIAAFIFGGLCAVLPSKTTIYAIAASEMGEEVINSPTATKAVKALDAWLDKQIREINNDQKPD